MNDELKKHPLLDLRDPAVLAGAPRLRVLTHLAAARILTEAGASDILALEPGAQLTSAMRTQIGARLSFLEDLNHRAAVHNTISSLIDYGRVAGLWPHEGLGVMAQHVLAPSIIDLSVARQSRVAEEMRDTLVAGLPRLLESTDPRMLQGAAIACVVLLDVMLSRPLLHAFADPDRVAIEGSGITLQHRAGQGASGEWRLRRWTVCAMTQTVVSRWQDNRGSATVSIDDALRALADALGEPGFPRNMSALMCMAEAFWAMRLPPYVLTLARDAASTESMPPSVLTRLMTGKRVRVAPPASDGANGARHRQRYAAGAPSPDQRAHLRALAQLRRCMRRLPPDRAMAERIINARLAEWFVQHEGVGGWVVVLARWVEYAISPERVHERGGRLRPNSILRYLSSYGPFLLTHAFDLDPNGVDENALMDRLDLLQQGGDLRSITVRYVALQELLGFSERYGVPRIALVDWWGAPPTGGRPSANLLTPIEYQRVLNALARRWAGREHEYAYRRLRALFFLAFWCGLRWGELAALPLDALCCLGHGRWREAVLMVRTSKTVYGERALPVHQLLPRDELEEVLAYVADLRSGMFGKMPADALLFGEVDDPRKGPDRVRTHDLLQRLMRDASGDRSLVFHALRHGAASFIALRLLLPEGAAWPSWLEPVSDRAFKLPDGVASWGDWLTGRPHHGHQRCAALSALIGHIDAAVTLLHYVHMAEMLIGEHARQHMPRLDVAAEAAVHGIKPTSMRQRRWRERLARARR